MSKRTNGTGAVFQQANGRWVARVRTVLGTRKRIAIDEQEAVAFLAELMERHRDELTGSYHGGREVPPYRKAISRGLRFTVLERDGFACVYCGGRPPDVTLAVDHRVSVADGGTDDLSNLAAACRDCNLGKNRRSIRPAPIADESRLSPTTH